MPVKILCAGTSSEIFDFVKRNLSQFDCEVVKATSLGLAIYLSHKNYPSVILSEVELNDGSGFDFLHEVKTDSHFRDIPFILIVTNTNDVENATAKADKVITYPLSSAAFLAEIMPLVAHRLDTREEETTE